MAHCIFPETPFRQRATNYHADTALPLLIREFLNHTNYAYSLEAQIFGGGSLREVSRDTASKTVKAARKILRKFDIAVTSEDTGGAVGRKIMFNTFSGDAIVLKTKNIRLSDWAPEYKIAGCI
jgi:chemotaxis protein CheD